MSISKILNTLENSWNRDDILLKIKNGLGPDEIINEFLTNNKLQVKELNNLLRPKDKVFLNQVEQLSTCEAKLINMINNLDNLKNREKNYTTNEKKIYLSNRVHTYRVPMNKISAFMINWSNKFVVITLLTISAIALTKQAWA